MGIFSSKTITYTSSQVYNLGDDSDNGGNVVAAAIVSSVLSGNSSNIGSNIREATNSSLSTRQRRAFDSLASSQPEKIFTAAISREVDVNPADVDSTLRTELNLQSNETLDILEAFVDDPEAAYFAAAWMAQNHPEIPQEDWTSEWNYTTRDIVISWNALGINYSATIAEPADFTNAVESESRVFYMFYRVVTQNTTYDNLGVLIDSSVSVSSAETYTYVLGTGKPVFDALDVTGGNLGEFYPVYFLRRFNKSVRDHETDEYGDLKKAFRKLYGQDVDKLLDQVEANISIDDIDFCYLVQGVSMGTKNQAGLEYLYTFWKTMMGSQESNKTDFTNYNPFRSGAYGEQITYENLVQGLSAGDPLETLNGDLVSAAIPPRLGRKPTKTKIVFSNEESEGIDAAGVYNPTTANSRFRYDLEFAYVNEEVFTGNFKQAVTNGTQKAEIGSYEILPGVGKDMWSREDSRFGWSTEALEVVFIYHQHERFKYKRLEIAGASLRNFIYRGHSEVYTAQAALGNEETGFIIPLHQPTAKGISTQAWNKLSNSTSWLVFNAYEQRKVKWYERGIFKVLLIVVAIVLIITIPQLGAALGNAVGVLGTNAAVGASLGLAGTAAVLGGFVANAIAATILVSVIQWGAVAIFGDKIGAIIGAIVSFLAIQVASGFVQTGSFSLDWGTIFRADNLMNMTNALSKGYVGYLGAEYEDILEDMESMTDKYEDELERIEKMYQDLFGSDEDGLFDPMLLVDSSLNLTESSEMFLSRTLLTGSDIVAITNAFVDFPRESLKLPKAIA